MDKRIITIVTALVAVVALVAGVYAVMNMEPEKTHTSENHIEYYGNGGTFDGKTGYDSLLTEISDCYFTYEGKDFVSWNTNADGTGKTYRPGETGTYGIKLYAQWTDHVERITIHVSIGGTVSMYDHITYVQDGKTYAYNEVPSTAKDGDYFLFTPDEGLVTALYDKGNGFISTSEETDRANIVTVNATDKDGKSVEVTFGIEDNCGKFTVPHDRSVEVSIHILSGKIPSN